MSIAHVSADGLRAVWDDVRRWLGEANRRYGERLMPESLWMLLRTNMASLYLARNGDGVASGCIVLQRLVELDGTATCYVLFAGGSLSPFEREAYAKIEEVARAVGAVRLRQQSPRTGWTRVHDGYWHPVAIVYEHTLGEQDESDAEAA